MIDVNTTCTVGQGLWSRNSATSSIACHWHWQYLGLRSYIYLYIYLFNLECFDIHGKKTVEKTPRSYWIILDHRSFKFCDVGKITPINKSFAGWLILGEASSWTDPLRSLPSGMGSLTCFFFNMFRWLCKLQSLNSMTSEVTKRLEKSDTSLRGELTWNYDTFCIFLYFPDAP